MKVPVAEPDITPADVGKVAECVASGWISGVSPYVKEFERSFAKWNGNKYGVATGSGTQGLHLGMAALKIGKGDEVIMPSFTMIASANACTYLGAKPVFVDIDPVTWNLDPQKIRDVITHQTKAIMPIHVYGHPCFPFDVEIQTDVGVKNIADIEIGSKVLSLFMTNGTPTYTKVVNKSKTPFEGKLIQIVLDNGVTIRATENHPFFIKHIGWIAAGNLKPYHTLYHVNAYEVGGVKNDEVLDRRGEKATKFDLSLSKIQAGDIEYVSPIQMVSNKGESKINETEKSLLGTLQQPIRKQQNPAIKKIRGLRKRIFGWINRRRWFHNVSIAWLKMVLSPCSGIQFIPQNNAVLSTNRIKPQHSHKKEETWFRKNWQNKTEVNSMAGIQMSASLGNDSTTSNSKEETVRFIDGVLQNKAGIIRGDAVFPKRIGDKEEDFGIKFPKIVSIEPVLFSSFVYNLETETHNYFANGLLVHNCDMKEIMEIALDEDLLIVEDCAEAHGAQYKRRNTGCFGEVGCYSFYANKIITTGEGGMIVTDDLEVAERAEWLRAHAFGRHGKHYWHEEVGYGYRMSGMQAALGLSQLERIDEYIQIHKVNAWKYKSQLIELAEKNIITFPVELENYSNVFWMFSILLRKHDRSEVMDKLAKKGIETRTFFYPLHRQPPYRQVRTLPQTDRISQLGINLPSGNTLNSEQILYVCDELKKVLN